MVPQDTQWLQGATMAEDEVDRFLRAHGTGTLSLARGDHAYGVPISFGYDGDACYFVFLTLGPESKKAAFAETSAETTLTVVETSGQFDWASVIVTGPIAELDADEWDAARDALADNAWHPSLFSEASPQGDVAGYRLDLDHVSGQKGSEFDLD